MACSSIQIVAFSTLGENSNEEIRIRRLLSAFNVIIFPFNRAKKVGSTIALIKLIKEVKPSLVVMEGSGVFGFIGLIWAKVFFGINYVVSSGDAIGPYLSMRYPWFYFIFNLYEKILYKNCVGFIGWTPYLLGRALTLGAKKGVTAEGFALYPTPIKGSRENSKINLRKKLNIPYDSIIFGIIGSISWNKNVKYSYGFELINAIKNVKNQKVHVVIGGDGDGIVQLKKIELMHNIKNVHFIGRVDQNDLIPTLEGFDCGSLPQSVDSVGSFRYTTKISEYLSSGIPFFTNQIPMAYDLDFENIFILPGKNPWDPVFINSITKLMDCFTDSKTKLESNISFNRSLFNQDFQVKRVSKFISDLLA